MRNLLIFTAAMVLVLGFFFWPNSHDPAYYDRVGTATPEQISVSEESFAYDGYTISPVALFTVKARVLGVERYHFDREAELSPLDLALGWGPMAEQKNLDAISIRQSGRFYFWRTDNFPIPRKDIERNSANMHLIPAYNSVRSAMLDAKEGDIVFFTGKLVNVTSPDGYRWNSSTTRNDTGAGACEVIYVTDFSIEE